MIRSAVGVLGALLCLTLGGTANAVDLRSGTYAAFTKDFGVGITSLHVVPQENILILHGDVATPITYMPDVGGYQIVILSDGSTGAVSAFNLNANDLAADVAYSVAPYDLIYADQNGDGDNDILLQSTSGGASYILTDNGTASILKPPASPVLTIGNQVYATDFTVSWTATSDVLYYELYEQAPASGLWSLVATENGLSTQLTGRSQDYYSYRVRACNGAGCGSYSATKTTYVNLPVSSTITVSNQTAYGNYTLSWPVPIRNQIGDSHRLEEKFGDNLWQNVPLANGSTSVAMKNKFEGEYAYRIVSCFYVFPFCQYEAPITVVVDYPLIPATPGDIQASPLDPLLEQGIGRFGLNWGPSSLNVGAYLLEQREPGSTQWHVIQYSLNQKANVVAYQQGLYYYRVKACNAYGCSGYTPEHSVLVSLPSASLSVSPTPSYDGNYTLSWTVPVPPEVTMQLISWSLQEKVAGGDWQTIDIPPSGSSLSINKDTGVYLYRRVLEYSKITCIIFPNCSTSYHTLFSNTVEVEVLIPPPVPASIFGPSTNNSGTYTISWSEVPQADHYILQQRQGAAGQWLSVGTNGDIRSASKEILGNSNGLYAYRVQACNVYGCSAFSAEHQITVSSGSPSIPNNVTAYVLPPGDNNVGAIGSSHEVGTDGSASYTIPIATAPGIGGLQPELSLTYNSNSGNGEVGVGWSIAGLSTLHRCGQNLTTDGTVDPVDFDDNDKYCLDGQRLVSVAGEYGADGTEYRTQVNNFSRITSQGSEGTEFIDINQENPYSGIEGSTHNPQSFTVVTRDGRTIKYGSTSASRLTRNMHFSICTRTETIIEIELGLHYKGCVWWSDRMLSRTYQWMIDQITDRYGNTITFSYENNDDTGEQRIKEIVYNNGKSTVNFDYDNRTDIAKGYFAGGVLLQSKRLSKIRSSEVDSNNNSTTLRFLKLEYDDTGSTGDSRLKSIKQCADELEQICLKPTLFTWQDGQSGFAAAGFSSIGNNYIASRAPFGLDVNGDGRTDLMTPAYGTWRFALSYGQGFNDWVDTGIPVAGWEYTHVLDYNSDGKQDLLVRSGNVWKILLSSGVDFQEIETTIPSHGYNKQPKIMDVNGDGRGDLVYVHTGNRWHIRLMTDTGFGPELDTGAPAYKHEHTLVADINGDGLPDLFVPSGDAWLAYLSTGDGFQITQTAVSTAGSTNSPKLMDVNGDGLIDVVSAVSGVWFIAFNQGGSFQAAINTGRSNIGYANARVADVNRDGRSDLIYYSASTWNVLRSTGEGFAAAEPLGIDARSEYAQALIVDLDASGLDSFIQPTTTGILHYMYLGERPDYMTSATNGMGVTTEFFYRPLNDDGDVDFYDRGKASQHPVFTEHNGNYVVSLLTQSNGVGGTNSTSYQYRERRVHMEGLGSLGFRQMITINNDTGIRSQATFSQDYANRLQGSVEEIQTIAPNGVVLSLTENEWQTVTVPGGDIDRHRRRVSQTTTTKRDLNGDFMYREVSDYEYDSYDNPTKITNTLYDESEMLLRDSITENRYTNDAGAGLIGLLNRVKAVTTVTGKDPVKRLVTSDYDLTNGRKTAEYIRHPDTEAILTETRYGEDKQGTVQLDTYGNSLATTVKGPDFATRDTRVAFLGNAGRFVSSKTNALDQTISYQYYGDNEFGNGAYPGKVKLETDPNGISTHFSYDAFGRVSKTIAAYGTLNEIVTETRYQWCDSSCREGGAYRLIRLTQGGTPTIVEIDILGRKLRESTIGMNGISINVDYEYDHLGHNIAVTEPYFDGDSAYWNFIDYDILGRAIETIDSSGRIDTVDYNGLTRVATVDVGVTHQTKTQVRNPLGELVSVTDTQNKTVVYGYDSAGRQTTVTAPNSHPISITYDVFGRKTSMTDPDKGYWQYVHNGLGLLIAQTDAKTQTTCMAYDLLDRMIDRIDNYQGSTPASQCGGDSANPNRARWNYDTATGAGKGRIASVVGEDGYSETYVYDGLGRNTRVTRVLKGQSYEVSTGYDSLSRPLTVSYPTSANHTRLSVRNTYNNLGYLTEVRNDATHYLYQAMLVGDARGNLLEASFGNGVTTQRTYNEATGYLSEIKSFTSIPGVANPDVQNLQVVFDTIGNLTHRSDSLAQFTENFDYDGNNRLIESSSDFGMGVRTHTVTYDADGLGNIKTKSGVGSYTYGGTCNGITAGPHAVTSITGIKNASYCYDANGNMISGDGRDISYTYFNKPDEIIKGTATTRMQYGPDRGLYYRQDINNGVTTSTTFVGGLYERIYHDNGNIEERHNIAGTSIVTYTKNADTTVESRTRFLHTDHLGSLVAISDESGQVEERFSFDAWGKRRLTNLPDLINFNNPDNWGTDAAMLGSSTTNKGFTGHEQLDGVGLIHMGGRVYDADIGRFLSADPFVQDRTNLQALNRYSYVENNPLSYTDPSGYFLKKLLKKAWKAFKAVIKHPWKVAKKILQKVAKVKWLSTVISLALNVVPGCQVWCSMVFNAAMAAANGGTIQSILKGAAIGAITSGLPGGEQLGGLAGFLNGAVQSEVVSVMLASGIMAKAQGGKFIDGVKGAAIGMAISGAIRHIMSGGAPPAGATTAQSSQQGAGAGSQAAPPAQNQSGILSVALDVVGKVWNLPNTALGLIYGGAGHVAGLIMGTNPYITFNNNAIQFHNNPFMTSAMTLGNVIIYGPRTSPTDSNIHFQNTPSGHTVGQEEYRHTLQGQALGPLYLPAHIIGGVRSLLTSPHQGLRHPVDSWHSNNFMETGPMQDRTF